MVDPKTLQFLWRYMVHADAQVLAASDGLSDEGYYREQEISAGSVHNLLVHCMKCRRRLGSSDSTAWVTRRQPTRPRSRGADLAGRWAALHQELLAFAAAQTPASLAAELRSVNRKGVAFRLPLWLCMLHVCDHATYHRGQTNSMIKRAGGTPPPGMLYTYGVREGFGQEE